MKLPYPRKPRWISPSSLGLFYRNPLLFYFDKCGPEDMRPPPQFQSNAMAVGTAFDTIAKTYLGAHVPVTKRHELSDEVKQRAQTMFKGWLNSGAPDSLPDGLIPEPGWSHDESDKTPMMGEIGGVPIGGYPDCTWRNPLWAGILDWKVNGAYSKKRPTPKDGFRFCWNDKGDRVDGLEPDMPMEDINKKWATQLTIYGWIEGLGDGSEPMNQILEQIIGQADSDVVMVARYQTKVSVDFQQELIQKLQRLWDAIQNESVVDESKLPNTSLEALRLMV